MNRKHLAFLCLLPLAGCGLYGRPTTAPSLGAAPATAPAAVASARAETPAPPIPPRTVSSGSAMTVGVLVAEVNGRGIFADNILAQIDAPLAANARQMPQGQFRTYATGLIRSKVMEEITDELEFAAAQRILSDEDRRAAGGATVAWRLKRISEAGGSEAVARANMLRDSGMDMDRAVERQHRSFVIRMYYERRIFPLVQVSADDIRQYYTANPKEFDQPAAVRFRMIRIDIPWDKRDAALARAIEARDLARKQHDFAELAATYNDDPKLKRERGLVDFTPRGTLSARKVDQALGELPDDAVSDVIEDVGAFHIVKVEQRRSARHAPFEEQAVQDSIRNRLWNTRFNQVREKEQKRLLGSAIMRFNDAMLSAAVDMAMQKYPLWTGRS